MDVRITAVISSYRLARRDAIVTALQQNWGFGKFFSDPEGMVSDRSKTEPESTLETTLQAIAGQVFEANGDEFCIVRFEILDASTGYYLRDRTISSDEFFEIMGQLISNRGSAA